MLENVLENGIASCKEELLEVTELFPIQDELPLIITNVATTPSEVPPIEISAPLALQQPEEQPQEAELLPAKSPEETK